MPQMEIDPAVLRQLALQHDQVARDTREWSKQPSDWLGAFPSTYGSIAAPVHEALVKYYAARERAGIALAKEHEYTAQSLRDSADAYERADQDMASEILHNGHDISDLTNKPNDVPSTGPNGSGPFTPPPGGGPTSTDTPPTSVGPNGAAPGTGAPGVQGGPGSSVAPPVSTEPTTTTSPAGSGIAASSTTTPLGSGVVPPGSVTPGPYGPGPGAGPVYSGSADGQSAPPPAGPTADAMPVVVPSPFAAAVAANKEKEAEPAYVVGDAVNDDLVLARTLLSSVLAAADSAMGTAWAVAVMRGPAGTGLFITSNEGRGWLPAGVFLPREVSTPWLWDEMLGDGDGNGSPWEGVADPARVLVEFGLAWGPKANAQLSALVSSGPIDPGLRSRLDGVAMAGLVGPAYDVDLREFTPGTTDRLGLTGSVAALEHVAQVADSQVRTRSIELATDADARVGRSVTVPVAAAGRQSRQRILALAESGQPIPRELWDELRDADDLLAAEMLSRRVDVGRVGLGELRLDNEVSDLRALVFERRCNELVLLLAGEPTRQSLRDAVYAHEQIVEHPLFVEVPAAVSVADVDRTAARPAVVPGAVSAPAVTAGPPSGAVSAPSTVVPDVTSERP
ncbi:ESX-1 secretion-associated protein [Nocardia sp. NBC_00565]|uniref:type VII secretion target n=1 Tax=Nocardia sp. NBC_00565 TaxID=2975993 RepID=UPI002E7FF015|nr:type VII secretion target [Nocardia sp. NBC_00565]WUC07677.1 ESX-1 secretion-associated protein [Nocardia sp. NBC_00565]